MKTIIHCDDVFEVLTAGPFPAGSNSDTAIHEHLASCTECKQLAEALKPACNLLRESLPTAEKQWLPVYLEAEEQAMVRSSKTVMRTIRPADELTSSRLHQVPRDPRRWPNRILATLCVALILMLLISGAAPWSSTSSATSPNWQALESMSLSKQCYSEQPSASSVVETSSGTTRQYLCCTNCHNNTPQGNHAAHAASLLASCGTCHN